MGSAISHRVDDGSSFKGTWRITDSGGHCNKWDNRKETCGQIVNSGDGKYKRMEEGYPRAIWKKIYPGNTLGS